jgi:type VI secretion system secreted protein Hcp
MAFEAYFKCKFNKQGASKGESTKNAWKDWVPILSYSHQVIAPRDAATGQASGKRAYKPIQFVHEWGASSPLFWTACARNEVIDEAHFEFVTTDKSGNEVTYFKVDLKNATVSAISQFVGNDEGADAGHARTADEAKQMELERIQLTFDMIDMSHVIAKTMFHDAWTEKLA